MYPTAISSHHHSFNSRITAAGSLIAIGIVFGDIGTSPLYTLNALFHGKVISETIALGSLSCIFWTLFFQTTLKYVIITLNADNKGEGGIFSLYALIRRYWGKWLIIPAMVGGAFLIADGIITPPISVASAVEGMQKVIPGINTVAITIAILVGLFIFQQFGTEKIGKIFGPVMVIWFTLIGVLGIMNLHGHYEVLKALNPVYGYKLLVEEPGGFWLLGSIFLCTTGAEALYSDMGHCGKNNIRISWIFVKITLVLSYAGQAAWLMQHTGEKMGSISPFFHSTPDSIYWLVLITATLATIIASQALISGCFTLINEAIRLNIWPKHRVIFPGKIKGQLYIPAINWFLMASCIAMVLYFRESSKMEAAFGLSVTLTMLMSTVLIGFYLRTKRIPVIIIALVTALFLMIELSFLVANLQKIREGGWITLVIGSILFLIMFVWRKGNEIKKSLIPTINIENYIPLIKKLSTDEDIPKNATNLVFLTASSKKNKIEKNAIDSIFNSGIPKRADIYWFVHVNVLDEPYELRYKAETLLKNDVYYIEFNLGFRIEPRIDFYFRKVVEEMVANAEVDLNDSKEFVYQQSNIGDFKFVIMNSFLSFDNDMPFMKNVFMRSYYNLKHLSVPEYVNFGLDRSHLLQEEYPLVVVPVMNHTLKRET